MVARDDLPVCGVCSAKAAASPPAVFMPGPDDVVDPGDNAANDIPAEVTPVVDDVPEVDVDPEPVVRRPADVRSAESVRADDLRRHRERLASSEGWRPWRGRSW